MITDLSVFILGVILESPTNPDKTVYSITNEGNKVFVKTLEKFLGNIQWNYTKFNLASIFICHIEKEWALKILIEKKQLLEEKEKSLEGEYETMNKQGIPKAGIHAKRHMQILTQAEIKSVEELMEVIQKETE